MPNSSRPVITGHKSVSILFYIRVEDWDEPYLVPKNTFAVSRDGHWRQSHGGSVLVRMRMTFCYVVDGKEVCEYVISERFAMSF
jgi:hypothetical protein